MKLHRNQLTGNAKTRFTLALCTVLALTAASLRADDYNKDKGAPGADSTSTSAKSSSLSRSDQKFIQDAARGDMMEIHMGRLGVQQANDDQLKQYAQKLIDDHTKANAELKTLAASKGLTLPDHHEGITSTDSSTSGTDAAGAPGTSTGSSSDRTQVRDKSSDKEDSHAEMQKLHGLSGSDFDRAFVKIAVKDHEKDVKEFEKASQKADDSDVKAFAAKTLPTLREHLQQAKSLQSQVGSAGAPASNVGIESDSKSGKINAADSK